MELKSNFATVAIAFSVMALALQGCSTTGDVVVSDSISGATSSAIPTISEPVKATAPEADVADIDPDSYVAPPVAEIKDVTEEIAALVTDDFKDSIVSAEEIGSDRVVINTTIAQAEGEDGSADSLQALALCEATVDLGYEHVNVMEADGTDYVVFGHPVVAPGECTEI